MSKSYIILDIELDQIKNFLDHVVEEAEKEIIEIVRNYKDGKFKHLDDYGNALFCPLGRLEIAFRAVLYEITVYIEHELQNAARKPWFASRKHKGPKSFMDLSKLTSQSLRSLKAVTDLNIGQIKQLIEEYYRFKIDNLPSAKFIFEIREMVNAFKHAKGLKNFRKKDLSKLFIPEYFEPEKQQAYDSIKHARKFIIGLWKATKQEPSHPEKLRELLSNDR